ncbi:hypothetical protein LCGC14_0992680 [marine sediment metagenome]|uniref:F5/8 type C domain-containing protein n=1 Tax=marine sediment metagenome TaxID=412755 RepID=A0A0F9NRY3_9ZZZZ
MGRVNHHVKYTDAEAQSVADTQIGTHAGLPTVHQDAPALIATHKALANDHHVQTSLVAQVGKECLVANYQVNPATGTAGLAPEAINDNNTGTESRLQSIGEYCEVLFEAVMSIKRYRIYGASTCNGTGRYKIQYWDLVNEVWADWVTGIVQRTTNDWTGLVTVSKVVTDKIRLVCTTVDTASGAGNRCYELEVIF